MKEKQLALRILEVVPPKNEAELQHVLCWNIYQYFFLLRIQAGKHKCY